MGRKPAGNVSRRRQVQQYLQQATSEKLLKGGLHVALKAAETAYALATEEPAVEQPWPALAAYRLAHLMLRKGADSITDLERVESLFLEAGRATVLGPLPRIYRLGVLDRLVRSAAEEDARALYASRLDQAFRVASGHIADPVENDPVIESPQFNMLELAAYFLGRGGELPTGKHARPEPLGKLLAEAGWFLVGPEREIARLRMAEQIARDELLARIESDPGCRWFILAPYRSRLGPLERYREQMLKASDSQLRLLVCLLEGRASTPSGEVNAVTGDPDKTDSFRQIRHRLRRRLATSFGLAPDEAVRTRPDGLHRLGDGLRIYGCVEESTYKSPN